MKNKLFSFLAICILFWGHLAWAQERIISFDSLIQPQYDGSMIVTEKIIVYHEGIKIRRGIYRDLPTKQGEQYELIQVLRNNNHEPSFVEKRSGYYRINTGDDTFLPHPSTSEFTIKYKVWNIPKSYHDYDEIYWNVTGDKWSFPIEHVTAKIELPEKVSIIQQASYIGKKGSVEPAQYQGKGKYVGRHLTLGEQLTIAVGYTPGIIAVTSVPEQSNKWLYAYLVYVSLMIWIWHKKGRDPNQKAIMPQFEPPKDITAAQAACIHNKGIRENILAISYIQMITSHFLKVSIIKNKFLTFNYDSYLLQKTDTPPSNQEEENVTWTQLLLDGQRNSALVRMAQDFKKKMKLSMKEYYTTNILWVYIPTLLLLIYYCITFQQVPLKIVTFFGLLFATIPFAQGSIVKQFLCSMLVTTVLVTILYTSSNYEITVMEIVLFFLLSSTSSIFYFLLIQPTFKGQRLLEHLKGLSMFLKATQNPSYKNIVKEPLLDETCMEKLFPYAMALGLEKEWENKFKNMFGNEHYNTFTSKHCFVSRNFTRTFSQCTSTSSGGSGGNGRAGGGSGGGGGGGR